MGWQGHPPLLLSFVLGSRPLTLREGGLLVSGRDSLKGWGPFVIRVGFHPHPRIKSGAGSSPLPSRERGSLWPSLIQRGDCWSTCCFVEASPRLFGSRATGGGIGIKVQTRRRRQTVGPPGGLDVQPPVIAQLVSSLVLQPPPPDDAGRRPPAKMIVRPNLERSAYPALVVVLLGPAPFRRAKGADWIPAFAGMTIRGGCRRLTCLLWRSQRNTPHPSPKATTSSVTGILRRVSLKHQRL